LQVVLLKILQSPSLYLEAGPNVEHLPEGLVGTGEAFTTLNWDYKTIPQEHLGDRQLVIGAGKALGGGPIKKDQYDAWSNLNLIGRGTLFKRSERFTLPNQEQIWRQILTRVSWYCR